MLPKTLKYGALLACGLLLLASRPLSAQYNRDDKPALSGTWGKKDGEQKIEFADKGVLKIAPHGDTAEIAIVCDYTIDKEGLVKVKVTGFEGKEEVKKKIVKHVPVGLKFSFKWTVKGDTAKLDDLTGQHVDHFKSHLEGDFERAK